MPNYDYKNLECDTEKGCPSYIEILHGVNENIETYKCPNCEKDIKVSKVLGNFSGIHFKGSGFYVNDYRKADNEMKKYYPRDPNKKKYY